MAIRILSFAVILFQAFGCSEYSDRELQEIELAKEVFIKGVDDQKNKKQLNNLRSISEKEGKPEPLEAIVNKAEKVYGDFTSILNAIVPSI
ncbi:MAG: hypothetical protein ACK4ND_18375 [Cytophagaceae bacterium]